jgi:putative flippase GtrA
MIKEHLNSFTRFTHLAGLASLIDFGLGYSFYNFLHQNAIVSTFFSNITGAFVAFMLNKNWVFAQNKNSEGKPIIISKYALVCIGNWALNSIFIAIFMKYTDFNYLSNRILSSFIVFAFYSYFANKWFVFQQLK